MGVSRCRGLRDDLQGFDRFVALGAPALRECAFGLNAKTPMVLALPNADRVDQDERFGPALLEALAIRSAVPVDVARSTIVRADNAGFAYALAAALEKLATETTDVLVGGIDSYFHPKVLLSLAEDCRLHSAWAEGGIVPTEGGAFLWLRRPTPRGSGPERQPIAMVERVATAMEASVMDPDVTDRAEAMTNILRTLFAHRIGGAGSSGGAGGPAWIMSDRNGEHCRLREWNKVESRLTMDIEDILHDKPIDEMGTAGAATGALLGVIACALFRMHKAPLPEVAVALAADGPARGGFLLRSVS